MRTCMSLFRGAVIVLLGMVVSRAQTTPPDQGGAIPQADAPSAAPARPFRLWGANLSFLLDAYADKNFNNPASGVNDLRNFDVVANSVRLNMAMVSVDRAPDPVGFHLDVGLGRALQIIHAGDRTPDNLQCFKQAYLSVKPRLWRGLEIDVGEFVTSAGAEVIESNQNWNYSRSLLFTWAIPYYHFGVRASFPVGTRFTGGVQVVNGWSNIENSTGTGKTVGVNGAYAWKRVTWTNTYYGGLATNRGTSGRRHLYDTAVLVTATEHLSYYVNFDYGRDNNAAGEVQRWTGIAGAGRLTIRKSYAIASRLEWFDDMNGLMTGRPQAIKEATVTAEHKIASWLLSRLEFREDWSNRAFCKREARDASNQPTILGALVAFIGPGK
jgi:Putative beta-barrel porin-2, OmpL-like. bbp2